jgi:peroxiredoxin Q/BCP
MSTTLKAGDKAPSFTATDQDGKKISLEDYRGRRLILYFYPKDDTPGCTAEACNLRDNYDLLREKGFEVLGVSVDNGKSHKKFEQKYGLPFRLVADDDKKVVNDYGVFGEKKFMGRKYMGTHRTTFVINGDGIIEKIIDKPDTKNHARQVLDALAE